METIVRGEFLLCCLFVKLFYASFCRRILFCSHLMCRLCCFVLFMSSRNVSYCGDYLQAKLKVEAERLNKAGVRLTLGYKKEDARMFFVFSNNFYLHTRITNICFHFMITYMSFTWHATVMQNAALLAIHVLIN